MVEKRIAAQKVWYVALGAISGEYAGNPLSFEASDVYGPFTEKQADELIELSKSFKKETYDVMAFRVNKSKNFKMVKELISSIIMDQNDEMG